MSPGRVAQSVARLTQESEVPGPIPDKAIYIRFSFRWFKKDSMFVHLVQVNRLGGLSLPRNNVVRVTDRPDRTIAVYRGCKATNRHQQQSLRCPLEVLKPHMFVKEVSPVVWNFDKDYYAFT